MPAHPQHRRLRPSSRRLAAGAAAVVVVAVVLTGCAGGQATTRKVVAATHSAPGVAGDPVGLLATASPSATPSTLPAATTPFTPAATLVPSPAGPTPVATVSASPVRALASRIAPDVFVSIPKALTAAQLTALVKATDATSVLQVSTGKVELGQGSTLAIGVNPSTFRPFTPQGTAESTALWQAVANGNVAVAHTVAAALGVVLGSDTSLVPTSGASSVFRVGALATTGLPGIGVVVDNRYDSVLGLTPGTGLVMTAAGHDPVVTAAVVMQTLGKTATATALRVPLTGAGRLTWVAPAVGPITSPFGYRTSPINGSKEFHGGIDIGAPLGAPIYAASSGSVLYAGPAEGFGNEVILSHAGGVQTVYGHMERILVTAGSPVSAGQPIALVGAEGDATGPHLHFEVHVNGQYTDPLAWLIAHGVNVQK